MIEKLTGYGLMTESQARQAVSSDAQRAEDRRAAEEARQVLSRLQTDLAEIRNVMETLVRDWARGYRSEHR
ncbi:hypothetical protein [Streptomyces sp. NPDC085540]|uniref:hypothetical protein n=1 Tax=Streptomyces sp. NPDC085540 TaxID=3365730 RepID=UPI0037CF9C0A